MQRTFIRTMGSYPAGAIHDWPWPTWQHIADHEGVRVAEFSRPVEEIVEDSLRKAPAKWLKERS